MLIFCKTNGFHDRFHDIMSIANVIARNIVTRVASNGAQSRNALVGLLRNPEIKYKIVYGNHEKIIEKKE